MRQFLLINIDPEHIPAIADRIENLCRGAGMNLSDAFKLKTCVTEAINNAVEHAYHFRRGTIDVDLGIEGEEFVVEISNETDGTTDPFDTRPVPETGAERGRGWQIISAWCDRASVSNRENRTIVRMAKRICN